VGGGGHFFSTEKRQKTIRDYTLFFSLLGPLTHSFASLPPAPLCMCVWKGLLVLHKERKTRTRKAQPPEVESSRVDKSLSPGRDWQGLTWVFEGVRKTPTYGRYTGRNQVPLLKEKVFLSLV